MTNLLDETIRDIEKFNQTIDKIKMIIYKDSLITWKQFFDIAKNTEYDSYHGPNIDMDLKFIFSDGVMYRHEYDGFECWKFIKTVPDNINKAILVKSFKYDWAEDN